MMKCITLAQPVIYLYTSRWFPKLRTVIKICLSWISQIKRQSPARYFQNSPNSLPLSASPILRGLSSSATLSLRPEWPRGHKKFYCAQFVWQGYQAVPQSLLVSVSLTLLTPLINNMGRFRPICYICYTSIAFSVKTTLVFIGGL
jgi:hypothetical protein